MQRHTPNVRSYSEVILRSLPCLYMPLNEIREDKTPDHSGFENHGTLVGSYNTEKGCCAENALLLDGG